MRRILLLGPPGSGKITRARELTRALAPLTGDGAIDLAWIYRGAGLDQPWLYHGQARCPDVTRGDFVPFRAPHHTCSEGALIGGGRWHRPGEASLAHGGTLLLDELAEFRRSAIDALAYVLRKGEAQISHWCAIPARPQLLIASANACPCGRLGAVEGFACTCSRRTIAGHTDRLASYAERLGLDEILPCRPKTVAELLGATT